MIDVTTVSSFAEATVSIGVADAPPLTATYQTRQFLPNQIMITYRYRPLKGEDGWVTHDWIAVRATAVGPRILKPAEDGTMRLGIENLRYAPISTHDYPEWLVKLMHELKPSGDIALAGA